MCVELYRWSIELEAIFVLPLAPRWVRHSYLSKTVAIPYTCGLSPIRWVPVVRWRNHYFPRNKEALPCCGRGPSCQPLHVQYSSDGSRSLTTLTTPRRAHHGGGRWRGVGGGRLGAGEDAAVDAHAKRSTRVHWFGCGVRLPSLQNNRGCG